MRSVITIDGPSGAGKGTIARSLAKKLGYRCLDTGALYRAVAWKAHKKKIDPNDGDALKKLIDDTDITFNGDSVIVDGVDVTHAIRTSEIGELSSQVSAVPVVREGLFSIQRNICLQGNVVIEGRDTGTAIIPESENKFYLDATVEERARRRYEELKLKDPGITLETTIEDIRKRDLRDLSRKTSPLRKTDDMIYIDSTNLSIDEVVEIMMKNVKGSE